MKPISFILMTAAVLAQAPAGRITGRILDPAGADVPGATVKAVNADTGVEAATVASGAGVYELLNLIPGRYQLTVESNGFKRLDRGPVAVRTGDVVPLDLSLELGAVTESVSVTASAPLLESATASLGRIIERKQILDLPIPNDNLNYLMLLVPGITVNSGPTARWNPSDIVTNSTAAGPGARAFSNAFQLDGASNTFSFGGLGRNRVQLFVAALPPREMVREMAVSTALYDATVGHFADASINMSTVSGTNRVRGAAFFSHNSRPLVTRAYFVNSSPGREWPYSRRNKYRAVLNGPIVVPALYQGRNRTFFSYGFESMDSMTPSSRVLTVPAAAHRQGDFSDLLPLGAVYQIYDPATTMQSGTLFIRQPFARNMVPATRFDPVARNLLRYYPLPNTAGLRGQSNYIGSATGRQDSTTHMVRVDHAAGARHRLYGSLLATRSSSLTADPLGTGATGQREAPSTYTGSLNDTIVLRPNLIAEVRYSVFRGYNPIRSNSNGLDAATLGFPPSLVSRLGPALTALPRIDMTGYESIGSEQPRGGQVYPWTLGLTGQGATGGVTWVRGSHTLRAGGEFRADFRNHDAFGNILPAFTFTGQWTNGPASTAATAPVGQSLAGLLLGLPFSGQHLINSPTSVVSKFGAMYFHDDWKITRKLTLNIGLRYEVETPETERYNRMNRPFDFDSASPVEAAARANYIANPIPEVPAAGFSAKGGFRFAGVNGEPRNIYDVDLNNVIPRVGLAYHAFRNTVIRAGYGVFLTQIASVAPLQQGFSASTPVQVSLDNGLSFRASLSNPFPDGIREPAGASAGLRTFLGQTTEVIVPRRNGYMQRWSLSIQQELPGRILLEAGYIGNKSIGEQGVDQFNAMPNRYLSTSPFRDQATINFLNAPVPNPFFGMPEFAGTTLQTRTVQRRQLLRPRPHFGGISGSANSGFAWYHAGYLQVDRRFGRGFFLQGSYTWSKLMEAQSRLNPGDPGFEHRISAEDAPHKLVIAGGWTVPFHSGPRWLRQTAGGWSIQGVYQYQVRVPLNFDTANPLFTGNFKNIALSGPERTLDRWFNTDGFERSAALQLADNVRAFPSRMASLRAPGWNGLDLSVSKDFRLREGLVFQLRAEAQDALNHPVFNAPNTIPTAATFGRITSTPTDDQRRVTLSGKLSW